MLYLSDNQLIELIQKYSNKAAFEELMKRHYGEVQSHVGYKISCPSDVEDVMQDIFISVYTKINQLRNIHKFKPWIRTISNNHIRNYYRNENDYEHYTHDEKLIENILVTRSFESDFIRKSMMSDIHKIILRIPNENFLPFILHHICNMSYAEIASITNLKHSTIRGKIARTKISAIEKLFSKSVPRETRRKIASNLSQIASSDDGGHLLNIVFPEKHFAGITKSIYATKIYYSGSLDNIMLLINNGSNTLKCLIKVKDSIAIPILLNRIPTHKKIHCIFFNPEVFPVARKYGEFKSYNKGQAFLASPTQNIKQYSLQDGVTELDRNNQTMLNRLLRFDPKIQDKLNEYNHTLNHRIYITMNQNQQIISAYAFFSQINSQIWKLIRHNSCSNPQHEQSCIITGTSTLLKQEFHVCYLNTSNSAKTFLEIASLLGFQVSSNFIASSLIPCI